MKEWHPRSWVAILMGVIVLVFVIVTALIRLFHGVSADPKIMADMINGWKELMLAIVGGLMVWLGGRTDENH